MVFVVTDTCTVVFVVTDTCTVVFVVTGTYTVVFVVTSTYMVVFVALLSLLLGRQTGHNVEIQDSGAGLRFQESLDVSTSVDIQSRTPG